MNIVPAQPADRAEIERLLASADLPTADITVERLETFLVIRQGASLAAVVGLEVAGDTALLRSLAVDDAFRGTGIGRQLVAAAEALAMRRGIRSIYLLTTLATDYFAALNYRVTPRDTAPAAIRATPQFAALCPATSSFMVKP